LGARLRAGRGDARVRVESSAKLELLHPTGDCQS
jgi:hypothetical protein